MPALPPIPSVIRVQMTFGGGEDFTAKCRFFYEYSGTSPTTAQLNTFSTAIRTAFASDLASLLNNSNVLESVEVTDMNSSTGAVGSDSTVVGGTRTGAQLPFSAALLHSHEVARRFRGGHSRVYWPFGSASDMHDAQTWSSAFTTACATGLAAFATAIAGAVWTGGGSLTLVNVSQYEGFTTHTGTTGRVRNVSTPRLSPLLDVVVSSLVRVGIAQIRKRLLALA